MFTKTGYCDWKHAIGAKGHLEKHNSTYAHKQAMLAWNEYKANSQRGLTIENRLDSARNLQIQQNRHYLRTVAEVLLLCAQQDIGLRGHRESQSSSNKGNFLEILHLVAQHDATVKDRLLCGPRNAVYTSPDIQNLLVNVMAGMVRENICNAIREAGVFSLLANKTRDVSKQGQLAVVLRYVDDTAVRFLTYKPATNLTAESLAAYLIETLSEYKLNSENIVSQGYDGASVMSGRWSRVQQCIKQVAPSAICALLCSCAELSFSRLHQSSPVCQRVFLSA